MLEGHKYSFPDKGVTDFAVEWPSGLFLEKFYKTVSLGLSSRAGWILQKRLSISGLQGSLAASILKNGTGKDE